MSKLICITGIDGSGKSTLIKTLNRKVEGSVVASIWQSFESNQQLFKTKRDVYEYMLSLTVNSRVIFLAHAIRFGLERALESRSEIVLLDGYYYKYFAPELVLGADPDLIRKLGDTFPQPDCIICLDADAELSFSRKQEITSYECGFAMEVSHETYVNFQESVIHKRRFFDQSSWKFLDARLSPEHLVDQAIEIIHST